MLLHELDAKKDMILALGGKYSARRVRVFGSVAKGEEGPDSDVDFLVDFPRGYDLFRQRLALTEQLQDFLGRPVGLVPEHDLNPHRRSHPLATTGA
jgi:hypothetical protein